MIDTHVHVWRPARGDYGWLTPDLPICRDFDLDDLRPLLGPIRGIVLVQAAPSTAETEFLLQVAHASAGLVRGVVGWIDLAAPALPGFAADPLLRGIRPMLQDIAETDWILRPTILAGLARARDAGLRLDALVTPRHLPILPALARAVEALPVVIDHAAKPAITPGAYAPWAAAIAAVAAQTDWCCKLSGLVTEAGADWHAAQLRPYVDHLLRCFGPARLMFGSDWPVATLRSSYARWFETAWSLIPPDDRHTVFTDTAQRFYGLTPPE